MTDTSGGKRNRGGGFTAASPTTLTENQHILLLFLLYCSGFS